jgi:hypothetical protein
MRQQKYIVLRFIGAYFLISIFSAILWNTPLYHNAKNTHILEGWLRILINIIRVLLGECFGASFVHEIAIYGEIS